MAAVDDRSSIGPAAPPVAARRADARSAGSGPETDPYAWIGDPFEPEVLALLAAERAYHDVRTAGLGALRETLGAEMAGRVPRAETGASWDEGGWTYRYDFLDDAQYPRLVRWRDGSGTQVLLDLDSLARAGGTPYCRAGLVSVSPDGRWLAWSVDLVGDEVYELRFRDLDEGEDLGEVVPRTMTTGAWSADSGSFLYTVPDATWHSYQARRHVLGTGIDTDLLVHQEDDARFELEVEGLRSGEWVVLHSFARDTSEEWLLPASDLGAAPRLVRAREDGVEYRLEHDPLQDRFLVVTNLGAPEFRIAWAPVSEPESWRELLAGSDDLRIHSVAAFRAGLVLSVRTGGAGVLRILPRVGAPYDVESPTPGGLARLGDNPDFAVDVVTVVVDSFIDPTEHVDLTLADGARRSRHRAEVVGVDPAAYVSERLLAPSGDVEVPVVVVRRRDTPLDGTAPCLLYGYGAYEATCESDWGIDWWSSLPSILDRGVVFAVGHPRGGGELGRGWWLDGHRETKPHTFDDQAAVADFLADGLVHPDRIVSRGLSAGGLLQGALYGRRPDRWAGVLAEVPFVDVVTSMLDASIPLTANEWAEWGDPRRPEDLAVMAAYSPMENRPAVEQRPPLLVTGAVHDTRVMVREPARWVAALRADDPASGAGSDPTSPVSAGTVLFRCETGAGAHGGPRGRYCELEYEAEVLAWCLAAMGRDHRPGQEVL